MTQNDPPAWSERLLAGGDPVPSCSSAEHFKFRQDFLRRRVLEAANAYENGRRLLHDACVQHLGAPNDDVVENALSCLFAIGDASDVSAVEAFVQHSNESVKKGGAYLAIRNSSTADGDVAHERFLA